MPYETYFEKEFTWKKTTQKEEFCEENQN